MPVLARVEWTIQTRPSRETVLDAFGRALSVVAGGPAPVCRCVETQAMEGGDQMVFATSLATEDWSIAAGTLELRARISPVLSSQGVTGEDIYVQPASGGLRGAAFLSARRPGSAVLEADATTRVPPSAATAFREAFGALAAPDEARGLRIATEGLSYRAGYGHLPGFDVLALLNVLAVLPSSDPRARTAQLWLGWQALATGAASEAVTRLAPLVAAGETLEVWCPADLRISTHAGRDPFRLDLAGAAQPAIAYAKIGLGLALVAAAEPARAAVLLREGLAACTEKYPGACGAATQAREALAALPMGG